MATGTIGAKIVLEGEANYRKALRDIKTAQAELRSEMKLCNTQFEGSEKSIEALTKKTEVLYKQYETSARKVEVYQNALKASTQREQEAAARIAQLQTTLSAAQKEYEQMADSSETTAEAMKEQQEAIAKLEKELQNANTDYDKATEKTQQYQTQLNYANVELQNFENELEDTKRQLNDAKNSTDNITDAVEEYAEETDNAGEKTTTFGSLLKANLSSEAIIAGVKALVKGIKEVTSACLDSGMAFEAAMSNVQALSGANSVELEKLTQKAKELGASTIYSATEVADAMSYMALAGWNSEQTLSGIGAVLDLAAASAMDLAEASDIVTDYLTAFGLKAEDAVQFTDQLAYAMSNSNTTVSQLGEAYKSCAATAASMGYSVEDVTAALMTMANAGVKGGEAGTSLRAIMINLATNVNGCADALSDYVQVYDETTGEMNSLSYILTGVAEKFDGLSDSEANALAKTIAGKTQFTGLETVLLGLNDAAKESGMSFQDYTAALVDCDGYAKQMADTMQNNLQGQVTALQSALEGLEISTYEVFDDTFKTAVSGATDAVQRLNKSVTSGDLSVSLNKMAKSLGDFAENAISTGEKALPKLIDMLTWLLDNGDIIAAGLAGIAAAQLTFSTVIPIVQTLTASWAAFSTATEGATIAQWLLNAAMEANPIGIVVTALAGLTAATVAYVHEISTEQTESEKAFDTLVRGYKDVADSSKSLATASKEFATNTKDEMTYVNGLVQELTSLNAKDELTIDNRKRVSEIVKELNTRYKDLNLTIDEQTGKLSENNTGWQEYINNQLKQAQLVRVEKELSDIYAQQADNSYALWEIGQELNASKERRAEIDERLREIQAKGADADAAELQEMQLLYEEAEKLNEQDANLVEIQTQLNESNGELAASTEELKEYMEDSLQVTLDAAGNIQELGNAVDGTREKIVEFSEQGSKAITDFYTSVQNGITGQLDLFSEYTAKAGVEWSDLVKNLNDQTSALEKWADNLAYLSEQGIDNGLYKKLAEMGPEGAAYVQAFVDMTTKDNNAWKEYQENFRKAVAIEESTTQEITEDYAKLAGYITDGMTLGITEGEDGVLEAIATVAEDAQDKFQEVNDSHSPSRVYEDLARYITDGMVLGLEEGEDDVTTQMGSLAYNTIDEAESKLKRAGAFEDIGYNIAAGIASGISSGTSEVVDAITALCESAINTTKTKLQIHSPSKVFEWMGEMSGEGYINGLQESMKGVNDAINTAMTSAYNVGSVATSGSDAVNQLLNVVAEYLPEIADNKQNVSVSLEGDAKGLFNAVRKQNTIYTKANGMSAFA